MHVSSDVTIHVLAARNAHTRSHSNKRDSPQHLSTMLGGLIDYLWSPNANSQVTSCTKEETSPGVNSRSADEFEFVLVEVSDATGEDWVYIEEPEQQQGIFI